MSTARYVIATKLNCLELSDWLGEFRLRKLLLLRLSFSPAGWAWAQCGGRGVLSDGGGRSLRRGRDRLCQEATAADQHGQDTAQRLFRLLQQDSWHRTVDEQCYDGWPMQSQQSLPQRHWRRRISGGVLLFGWHYDARHQQRVLHDMIWLCSSLSCCAIVTLSKFVFSTGLGLDLDVFVLVLSRSAVSHEYIYIEQFAM